MLAFLLTTLKYLILLMTQMGIFSIDPINILDVLLSLVKSAGYLLFWVIIIRSLIIWINQVHEMSDYVLIQLTETLIVLIRRIVPVISGIAYYIV